MEGRRGLDSLVDKAEDLKMLVTYLWYVVNALEKGKPMPDFVSGFNDADVLDCFCDLCSAIRRLRGSVDGE